MSNDKMVKADAAREQLMVRVERSKAIIQPVLPKHVHFEVVLAQMEKHLYENPKLLEATPGSIFWSFVHAAEVGLSIGNLFGEAYIIPFKKKNILLANFVPGYKGMLKLSYQSQLVSAVDAYVVYDHDVFEVDLGDDRKPVTYKPNLLVEKPGEVIAVYTKIRLASGATKHDVMPRWRLDRIRSASPGARNPDHPWNLHPDEMYRKTGLRHALKDAPKSNELDRALMLDERAETDAIEKYEDEPHVPGLDDEPEGRAQQSRARVQQRAQAAQLNAKPAITATGTVVEQKTPEPQPAQAAPPAQPPAQQAAPAAGEPPPMADDPGGGEEVFD